MMFVCGWGLAQLPQGPMAPGMPPAQDSEGLVGGRLVGEVLLHGPSEAAYCDLADSFFEDSRPIQARYFYRKALEMKADSERAKAGIKKSNERLDHLHQRYAEFQEKADSGAGVRNYCSMAAIRFHLGFPDEAMKILSDAERRHGMMIDIAGLKTTFRHAQIHEQELVHRLEKEMQMAVVQRDGKQAAVLYGRMVYLTLGKKDVLDKIVEAQAFLPDQFDAKGIAAILGMTEAKETVEKEVKQPEPEEEVRQAPEHAKE